MAIKIGYSAHVFTDRVKKIEVDNDFIKMPDITGRGPLAG